MRELLPRLFVYNFGKKALQKMSVVALIAAMVFFANESKAQIIVETFEDAGWTSGAYAAAVTTTVNSTYVSANSVAITTNAGTTATNSVATSLTGPKVSGGYSWAFAKASVLMVTQTTANTGSYTLIHSYKAVLALSSAGGYLITPIIPTGVATVTGWASKSGGASSVTMAVNSTLASGNTYATSAFTSLSSTYGSGGAGRVAFTYSPNIASPTMVGFISGGVWLDDIVITPFLSDVSTGTASAGNVGANSAIVTANVLKSASAAAVTASGICYVLGAVTPTTANSIVAKPDNLNASWDATISGLASSTQYTVRAYATNSNGTYYGSSITFTTTAGNTPEPSNYPTSFSAAISLTSNSQGAITLTWTDATGTTLPGNYLIRGATASYAAITSPVDGTAVADGGLDKNVAYGVQTATVTGLTANTQYYFEIFPYTNTGASIDYKNSATPPQATATTAANSVATQKFRSVATGNWSSTSTWQTSPDGGVNWVSASLTPTSSADSILISNGTTVTIDAAVTAPNLTVGGGTSGILQFEQTTARTLTVSGDVTIASGGIFQSNASGTVTTHSLSLSGNITNSGTLDFSTNANTAGADITFTGASNSTLSGTGGTTDLYTLTMSKSSISQVVDVNLSNFSVRGSTSAAAGALLASGSGTGTLKFSGTNTFSGTLWSTNAYIIPSTMELWLNNPNFRVNGLGGSPTNNGILRVSNGTYVVGTGSGNTMGASVGATFTFDGGRTTFASRFNTANMVTFNLSGSAIVNIDSVTNTSATTSFGLTSALNTINITGGTINLVQASTAGTPSDYNINGTNPTISGGTLNVGTAATTGTSFVMQGYTPSVVAVKTAKLNAATTIMGDLTISSGGTFNANSQSFSLTGNWSNSGLFTNTGSTATFNGTGAQSITNSSGETFNSLTVNKSSGVLTLANAVTVNSTLTLTSGIVDLAANNLTVATAGTIATPSSSSYLATTGAGGVVHNYSAGSFTFAVGPSNTGTDYTPVTITNTGAVSQTYTVGVTSPTTYSPSADAANYNWSIGTTGGTSASTLAFSWSNAGANLAASAASGTAYQYNGSNFTNKGGSTATGTPNVTTVTGITDFSNTAWTVAIATAATAPTVTTATATSITSSSALSGGNVSSDGGATITERGVVYSSTSNPPTTTDSKATATGTTGLFTKTLSGLAANTTYHARAYAINSVGTSYGAVDDFTTLAAAVAPTVITTVVTSVTSSSASTGGNVSSDGGDAVTERGVVYGTSPNPTTSNTKVTDASGGQGTYTSSLTGLTSNTTYHVRAYAINTVGTSYGGDSSFITPAVKPTVSGSLNPFTNVAANSFTINFSVGNGSSRLVLVKTGLVVDGSPVDGTSYTANTVFGSGTQIGTGNYVVYNGSGTSVTVTGLNSNSPYAVAVYEFNGSAGTESYIGTAVTGTQSTSQGTYYSQSSSDATSTSTWNSARNGTGTAPTNFIGGDIFIVQSGHSLTTSGAWTISGTSNKLEIENGGTLTATFLITVTTFQVDNGGTYNHNAAGSSTNGASTDFPGSTGTGRVFGASSNVIISNWATSTGSPVALPTINSPGWGNLTINVATWAGSLNMAGALTAIQGDLNIQSTGGTTREFRLTGTTSGTTLSIGGNLNLTGGIFNTTSGTNTGAIVVNVGGNLVMSGGTLGEASGNTNVAYNITGALNFSAGTVSSAAGVTYTVGGGMNVSGGTFNLGTSSGHTTTIAVTGDITLTNAGQMSNVSSSNNIVSCTGNFNMSGTSLYQMQNSSSSGHTLSLTIGGDFNMTAGTFTGGSSSQKATVTFSGGTASVTFTAGGTITASKPTDWTIAAGKTVTLNSNLPVTTSTLVGTVTVNGTLNCITNNVTGSGAFTLSSGGTLQIGSAAGISSTAGTGSIQVTGARSFSTGGNYEYNNSSATQVTGNQLPATVNNLTINNGGGSTGVSLTNNVTVSGTLGFTSGRVTTAANAVTIAATGSVSGAGAGKYVNGNLKKFIPASASSATFEIGDATNYAPVTTAFAGTITAATGSITASTTGTDHPQIATSGINSNLSVNRYWTLTNNSSLPGMNSYAPTFTFVSADKDGGLNTNNVVIREYSNPAWSVTTTGTLASLSTQATGVTTFGDFQVGEVNPLTAGSNPSNVAFCGTGSTNFSTTASTSIPTPTIKWQQDPNTGTFADLSDGGVYSNTSTTTLNISSVAGLNNYKYRAVFTNINGSVNTSSATLTVNSIPTTPTINAGGPTTFCSGGSVTLTSSSASGNQWYVGGNLISGATSNTYNVTATGSYTVIVTTNGCSSSESSATAVTVNAVPSMPTINAGGPTTFCTGGSVTLTSSSASGNQWYVDGNLINGATSDTYNVTATGSYTVIVTTNGCTSPESSATQVTVNTIPSTPSITPAGSTTICSGGDVTLTSSSITGNQWYIGGSPISGATGSTYGAATTGSYTVVVSANGCSSASSPATTVSINNNNTWLGTSTNWNNPANWSCGIVPNGSTVDAYIPSTSNAPSFNTDITVHNIVFQSTSNTDIFIGGHTLTLTGAVTGGGFLRANNGTNLVINGAAGTLKFNSAYGAVNNLTLGASASATLGSALAVYNLVTVGAGATLNSAGFLSLKSNYATTAHVGQLTTGTITGNVTVERYIPGNAFQAWRLLSVPTQGSQTFRQAWQENQAPMVVGTAGYGTLMGHYSGTGFDYVATTNNSSLKTWTSSTGTFDVTISSTNTIMQTKAGYLLYIKGDRSITPSMSTNTTNATTLRTTGTLYQGNQTSAAVPAGKYAVIGNVYPAAIDFTALTKDTSATGLYNTFYVWDPKLYGNSGTGGYQTFAKANGWVPTPGGGSYGYGTPNTTIEQGQAFMVIARATSTGTATVGFTEAAKVVHNGNVFTRTTPMNRLSAALILNGHTDPADGNTVVFGAGYSENVPKATNLDENFAITAEGQSTSVSSRATEAKDGDRIVYNLSNLREGQQYTIELNAENFNGQQAYLQDSYLHTTTPINLDGKTTVSFTANSSTTRRFAVVFGKTVSTPAITMGAGKITVAPNPVTGRIINLQFSNKVDGAYRIAFTNAAGQSVYSTTVNHSGNSSTQQVKLPKLAQGIYELKVTSADGKTESQRIVVSN